MMYDASEKQAIRHSVDGFCTVIGCPECETRRAKLIAPGKALVALKSDLEAENADLLARLAEAQEQVKVLESALDDRKVALDEVSALAMQHLDDLTWFREGLCLLVAAMLEQLDEIEAGRRGYDQAFLAASQLVGVFHQVSHLRQ